VLAGAYVLLAALVVASLPAVAPRLVAAGIAAVLAAVLWRRLAAPSPAAGDDGFGAWAPLADALDLPLVRLDAAGTVRDRNEAHRRCFGERRGTRAWLGDARPFAPGGDRPLELAQGPRSDGTPLDVELRGADGGAHRRLRVARTSGPDGGALLLCLDVTEEARTALQLRRLQRLGTLGQLAGGVAHDFNNLLTIILGNAATILEGEAELDDWTRGDVELIVEAARRGTDLTQRLLAFTRRKVVRPEVCDANVRIRDLVPLLERTLGSRVELVLDLHDAPLMVRLDIGEFENALLNLAANARDAMDGAGRLLVRTRELPPTELQGARVRVAVEDTGPGVPEARRASIFDPFMTTKEEEAGSGLGLAMVHAFVRGAGGSVRLDDSGRPGACFLLDLPRHAAGTAPPPEPAPTVPPPAPGAGPRILVVEDDEHVASLLRRVLERVGHALVVEQEAAPALARLRAGERFDLLLTDIVLPGGMDGVELMRAVRALRPGFRVLLISGYDRQALAGEPLPEHEVAFLKKPFSRRALEQAVADLLGRTQLRL
jgi:signal transduction histidine kinase